MAHSLVHIDVGGGASMKADIHLQQPPGHGRIVTNQARQRFVQLLGGIHVILAWRRWHAGGGENAPRAGLAAVEMTDVGLAAEDRDSEGVGHRHVVPVNHSRDVDGVSSSNQLLDSLYRARAVLEQGGETHVVESEKKILISDGFLVENDRRL